MPGFWDSFEDFFTKPLVGFLYNELKYTAARGSARNMAEAFGLNPNSERDTECFRELWQLTAVANKLSDDTHDLAHAETGYLLSLLPRVAKLIAEKRPPHRERLKLSDRFDDLSPTIGIHGVAAPLGLDNVQNADLDRKYVVFSDHHMLFPGNRQQFFDARCNKALYLEVLTEYYLHEDFNLVENGDLEELLVLEPELDEIRGIGYWTWDRVIAYRESKKIPQLQKVISANRDYYDTVLQFHRHGRFFKLTGNHDYDMALPRFRDVVADAVGEDYPLAVDVVTLSSNGDARYLICHGHQFDTSCTPYVAKMLGESFSQSQSWAFEGPDRQWKWPRPETSRLEDPIPNWLDGSVHLTNDVVTDTAALGYLKDMGISDLSAAFFAAKGDLDTSPNQWEHIQGKNIGWEYFYDPSDPTKTVDAGTAVKFQVKTGDRWFKYRHLNEQRIVDFVQSAKWPREVPTLLLGHSHEARIQSGRGQPADPGVGCYINSAAAGRFENLIWGVEIDAGRPTVVSWHYRDGPDERGPIIRTVWESRLDPRDGIGRILAPASSEAVVTRSRRVAAANMILRTLLPS